MLIEFQVLSSVGAGWGAVLVLATLIICPLAFITVMRADPSDR